MITKQQILELEYRLIEAIKTSDVSFLRDILHDDLLFLAPNGEVVTKQMDLASHQAGEMKVEALTPTLEEICVLGDTVIVVIVYETKGTMLSKPIEGTFRYLRVWKMFDGKPRVVAGSCSMI